MKQYIALIRKESKSVFGVDFPDFPGCITAADSLEAVQARAVEVLDFHVEGMVEDGEPLPKPSSLDDVLADPENLENLVVAVFIPLAPKKSKKVRADITVPDAILRQVDRYVEKTDGVNRSSFFANAAMARLQHVGLPATKSKRTHASPRRVVSRPMRTPAERQVSTARGHRVVAAQLYKRSIASCGPKVSTVKGSKRSTVKPAKGITRKTGTKRARTST